MRSIEDLAALADGSEVTGAVRGRLVAEGGVVLLLDGDRQVRLGGAQLVRTLAAGIPPRVGTRRWFDDPADVHGTFRRTSDEIVAVRLTRVVVRRDEGTDSLDLAPPAGS